ncbi:MAG TPA: SRPBCC family protein [Thermoanaerobaculia bacterium]
MRDAAVSSSHQGTGSFSRSTPGSISGFDAGSAHSNQDDANMMLRVGQAAMVLSGAALVAFAVKQGRWKTLGAAALAGTPLIYRRTTGHWPVPQALAEKSEELLASPPLEAAVTIDKPASELYDFWHRLENLPRFMKNLDEVVDLGGGRSHWRGKSALGVKAEWDAEILDEEPGRSLSWSSLPGSQVHHAGTVRFEDARNGRGTVVRVVLELRGALGQLVDKTLHGATQQQVREDLKRLKELLETGEVATTDGQPHGTRSLIGRLHNPI